MKYPHEQGETAMPTGPVPTVFEAIVRKKCLTATYNKLPIVLAPHIIFTRHGEMYVDGVVLEREGKPPREFKVGTFKLIGLVDLALVDRNFQVSELFSPSDPKYADNALMAVEHA
ncbi:MAG: hypothetical protein EOP89_11160 [Lysobacteraceae bacterium]|nr:MAG: hypothetical protein EOP89_11160 [Xanthomonadaceae bacterium]